MTARPATEPASSRLADALEPYRRDVDAALALRIPTDAPDAYAGSLADFLAKARAPRASPVVYDPIRHVLEAGGKRLRPIGCLLACEAVCGDAKRALPTAAGLELLHTFSLVHDDVMDNDLTRRGRPTVHALWGPGIAIVAGDGLFSLAFEAIADNADVEGVDPAVVVEVSRRAAQVSFELCAGQTDDLLFEKSDDVDLARYNEMIRQKTGVLIALSIEAGARLGGAPPGDVQAFATFGLQMGLAFQVKDDLLDLVGEEAEIGKPVGSDIRAGKKTYPVLHALANLQGKARERLGEILGAPERETTATMVAEALRLLDKAGSLQAAQDEADRCVAAAKRALGDVKGVRSARAMALLSDVAEYVAARTR